MAITFEGLSAQIDGASGGSCNWPSGHQTDDVGILIIEGDGASTTVTPTGWTHVTGSPMVDVATTSGSKLHVLWKRATSSSEAAVSVPDPGNHQVSRMAIFRGCVTSGDPWNAVQTSTDAGTPTTVTLPAVTTTDNNSLVVLIASRANDSASTTTFSVPVNANLTNLVEHGEAGTIAGNGGGFAISSGEKVTAGATGTTTQARSVSSPFCAMTLALTPLVTESHSGTVTASGGGSATVTNSTNRDYAVVAAGGGDASVAKSTDRNYTATATGGGDAVVANNTDRSTILTATGGGELTAVHATERSETITASGGGDAVLDGLAAETHSGSLIGSGGGSATTAGEKAALYNVIATGGGEAVLVATGDHNATIEASGGGDSTLAATTVRYLALIGSGGGDATLVGEGDDQEHHSGTLVGSGGGSAALVASKGVVEALTASGGGSSTLSGTTARFIVLIAGGGGDATLRDVGPTQVRVVSVGMSVSGPSLSVTLGPTPVSSSSGTRIRLGMELENG